MSIGTVIGGQFRIAELSQHWRIIRGTPYRDVIAQRLTDGAFVAIAVRDPWA